MLSTANTKQGAVIQTCNSLAYRCLRCPSLCTVWRGAQVRQGDENSEAWIHNMDAWVRWSPRWVPGTYTDHMNEVDALGTCMNRVDESSPVPTTQDEPTSPTASHETKWFSVQYHASGNSAEGFTLMLRTWRSCVTQLYPSCC